MRPEQATPAGHMNVTDIGQIQFGRSTNLDVGSPFIAGSTGWNVNYNMGNPKEYIRFNVQSKARPDESIRIGRLVSHYFSPGSVVTIPSLYTAGKYGAGRIIDIKNIDGAKHGGPDGSVVPLALVEFASGQHPGHGGVSSSAPVRVSNIGLAFLKKESRNRIDDLTRSFRLRVRA